MRLDTFKPVIYETGLGDVISPPFDTLTENEITELRKNPYNIMNLSLFEDDECKERLQDWINKGILKSFERESLIILRQRYSSNGSFFERLGVIGVVDISRPENKFLEHENVIPEYVQQRKRHILKLSAQTEPVFTVVDSPDLHSILWEIMKKKGCAKSYEEPKGTWNDICIVNEEEYIRKMREDLMERVTIIADGHHRYRAMNELMRETSGLWNKIMVYVTSIEADSTRIGEVHRIFDLWDGVYEDLSKFYDFHRFEGEGKVPAPSLVNMESTIVLKKKEKMKQYEDVYIIDEFLNLGKGKKENLHLEYTSRLEKLNEEIEKNRNRGGLIMPVWEKKKFYEIVQKGKLLPAKSTYFYPKIPSGIAFYLMEKIECRCSSGGRAADS
ncbi:DUF1015 family protein [Cuniculiplasma sp. SKW3]|uniref:DUF1015 family protein n=1 Tax=Cuniculiplasma sp. SKW3 TaxID=3400170 RepID=UPI003FD55CED